MIRQRPIKGGRERLSGSVERRIQRWVRFQSRRFNCSASFVVAVAVAEAAGIQIDGYASHARRKRAA